MTPSPRDDPSAPSAGPVVVLAGGVGAAEGAAGAAGGAGGGEAGGDSPQEGSMMAAAARDARSPAARRVPRRLSLMEFSRPEASSAGVGGS